MSKTSSSPAPTVPRDAGLAYHITTAARLPEIQETGLRTDWTGDKYRGSAEEWLETVSEETGIPLPIDRRLAVFAHVSPDHVDEQLADELNDVLATQGCVVIDLKALDVPLTIADMTPLTHLIDGIVISENEDWGPTDDELRDYAIEYLESITMLNSWRELQMATAGKDYPELMISGDVPPEAIIDTFSARPDDD